MDLNKKYTDFELLRRFINQIKIICDYSSAKTQASKKRTLKAKDENQNCNIIYEK